MLQDTASLKQLSLDMVPGGPEFQDSKPFEQAITQIPLYLIDTDPVYQRDHRIARHKKRWEKMADKFDPDLCQIGDVFPLGNGRFACSDGGNRCEMLKSLGYTSAPWRVLPKAPLKKQSKNFVGVNTQRKQLTAVDIFTADMHDPHVLTIKSILKDNGFEAKADDGRITYPEISGGIETLKAILTSQQSQGERVLARTLILARHWRKGVKAKIQGVQLHCLAALIAKQRFDEDSLRRALTTHPWRREADLIRRNYDIKTKAMPLRVATEIANAYNKGKSKDHPQGRLDAKIMEHTDVAIRANLTRAPAA